MPGPKEVSVKCQTPRCHQGQIRVDGCQQPPVLTILTAQSSTLHPIHVSQASRPTHLITRHPPKETRHHSYTHHTHHSIRTKTITTHFYSA